MVELQLLDVVVVACHVDGGGGDEVELLADVIQRHGVGQLWCALLVGHRQVGGHGGVLLRIGIGCPGEECHLLSGCRAGPDVLGLEVVGTQHVYLVDEVGGRDGGLGVEPALRVVVGGGHQLESVVAGGGGKLQVLDGYAAGHVARSTARSVACDGVVHNLGDGDAVLAARHLSDGGRSRGTRGSIQVVVGGHLERHLLLQFRGTAG